MTKQKSTKRALLMSSLSLLLCVSMLIGTTFAWFTDSVTSGNNKIVAGNLDIELEYATTPNGAYTSVEGKGDLFVAPAGETKGLWEPGHTEVAYLKVRNAGTLNLKYNLSVAPFTEVVGKNEAGNDIRLSEILKFFATEPSETAPAEFTRETAQAQASASDANLKEYGKEDVVLAPGASHYIAVAVYMPESVGNEANYRGTKIPEISFALTLLATQYTAENDSFGKDYDEDAIFYDVLATTDAELKAAILNEKAKTIAIDGDLTYDWENNFYANSKALYMKGKTFVGYNKDDSIKFKGYGSANPIVDVTMKNLTVKDETVGDKETAWEHGHLEFEGLNASNVEFADSIMLAGNNTLTDCYMNNAVKSWYGVWIEGGNTVLENCVFEGTRAVKLHECYGTEIESVEIDSCRFVTLSEKPGVVIGDLNADTKVWIHDSEFIACQAGDQGKYIYESDTDVATFDFEEENNLVVTDKAAEGLYKSADGVYYATTANGLNSGINAAGDGETVALAKDVVYTGSGYANITKNITLDLNGNNISTTSLGVVAKAGTIKNGTVTNPVGVRAALRTSTGVSIENVTVVSPKNGGITVASENRLPSIKNVTIEAQTYGIELQYGASVGIIENVTINAEQNGIVCQAGTVGEIKNCTINGKENGVWGQLKGVYDLSLNFTNCQVAGKNYGVYLRDEGESPVPDGIAYLNYDNATTFEGGAKDFEFFFGQKDKLVINGNKVVKMIATAADLFAFANDVNASANAFSGQLVLLTADIDLENALWTPIGQTGATQFKGVFDGQGHTISNLNVDSLTQTGANYSSGLFGWLNKATVKNVTVDGATVKGNHNVAVIAGYLETSGCTVANCTVKNAAVVAKHANSDACGDKVGAVVGYAANAGVKVENCSAENCTVTAGRDAGQIVGAGKAANVVGCTATDVTVTAGGDCTGANVNNAVIGRIL